MNGERNMSANIICILIAIVVYLVGMVAIGAYYSKGQSDAHEFYLGGRKLGPIVTALSTEASDMSASDMIIRRSCATGNTSMRSARAHSSCAVYTSSS